ncbi:MAG: hypothetical protein Q8N05_01415 [Bacteroidota bacterium]|nr:hypothetical protein [Bacteroidota bacterium]
MNDQTKYNPQHHHRRSIRLKGYDYSQDGLYFITVCCQNRKCWFGKIENEEMIFNEYGQIASNEWIKLTDRFPNFELDVFQIMPNHIHAIISLNTVGAGFTPDLNDTNEIKGQPQGIAPTLVGDMVGAYKSIVANGCLEIFKIKWGGINSVPMMGKIWQRNFHEHIIRNEQSYQIISDYIINNPAKWKDDKFFNQ